MLFRVWALDLGSIHPVHPSKTPAFITNSLDSFTFPNHGRMCAVEIKTSRDYPRHGEFTPDYVFSRVKEEFNQVIHAYRKWKFNGTVFIIHIFFFRTTKRLYLKWKSIVLSRVMVHCDINWGHTMTKSNIEIK